MPSIQVTGQLVDPTTGVEGSADIRIASLINYGQTTKKSISHKSTDASGNYDFQLVEGKHAFYVKYDGQRVFTKIGTAIVGEGSPSPIDIITLIETSSGEVDPIIISQLQQIAAEAAQSASDAQDAAELANQRFQGSVSQFIQSDSFPGGAGTRVEFAEFYAGSGVGGGVWAKTGVTGLTPSQTPIQLGAAKFTDSIGDEWELVVQWFAIPSQVGHQISASSDLSAFVNILISSYTDFEILLPSGDLYYQSEIDTKTLIKHTITLRGMGKGVTRCHPDDSYGGWFITINDNWKEGEDSLQVTDSDKRGGNILDFSIIGNRDTNSPTTSGIRTYDRVDNLTFRSVEIMFLNGTGLALGSEGPLGLCRESNFYDVTVRGCGQIGGLPALIISGGDSVADGTNHLYFFGTRLLYNFGECIIKPPATPNVEQTVRRIEFYGTMSHGITGRLTDLIVAEGRVEDIRFEGLNTNSSQAGKACVRVRPADGFAPNGITIDATISAALGDGIVIEGANSTDITVRATPTQIAGDAIRYDPSSLTTRTNYLRVRGQEVGDGINIDASVTNFVTQNESFGYTAAELSDISNNVNVANKYAGKPVFEVGNARKLYATSSSAGSAWRDSSGNAVIVPV